jgi:hypothetical protein
LEYRLPTWREETGISGDAPGYSDIDARDFRFPFGDYFGLAIDTTEINTWCGVKA